MHGRAPLFDSYASSKMAWSNLNKTFQELIELRLQEQNPGGVRVEVRQHNNYVSRK